MTPTFNKAALKKARSISPLITGSGGGNPGRFLLQLSIALEDDGFHPVVDFAFRLPFLIAVGGSIPFSIVQAIFEHSFYDHEVHGVYHS